MSVCHVHQAQDCHEGCPYREHAKVTRSQSKLKPLTTKERSDMERLGQKWKFQRASNEEIKRFRLLERRHWTKSPQ